MKMEVSILTVVVCPDPLFSVPSYSSAMNTPDLQSPRPPASLYKPKRPLHPSSSQRKKDPDDTETAAEASYKNGIPP